MKNFSILFIAAILCLSACNNNNTQPPKPKPSIHIFTHNIDKVEQLCNQEASQDIYDLSGAGYAYIDIDSDGIEELYIRDEAADCGWLLCCGADSIQFIASENYKLHFSKLGNIVMLSGSAGTGCFYTKYFQIENSIYVGPDFYELDEYVFSGDTTKTSYYSTKEDDVLLSEDKVKPFMELISKIKNNGEEWELLTENLQFKPFYELTGKVPEDAISESE